eukprot:TRINITY_DN1555_c0_g1_i1.p1 TRINITY_DN1555_c0_g1~~TRINITY_DN1555_c0_g1_i1.p1  ORF type:complete len:1133 (+),score=232.41 TRINITY_DN1555_c0_g1_i1:76-3474(+)
MSFISERPLYSNSGDAFSSPFAQRGSLSPPVKVRGGEAVADAVQLQEKPADSPKPPSVDKNALSGDFRSIRGIPNWLLDTLDEYKLPVPRPLQERSLHLLSKHCNVMTVSGRREGRGVTMAIGGLGKLNFACRGLQVVICTVDTAAGNMISEYMRSMLRKSLKDADAVSESAWHTMILSATDTTEIADNIERLSSAGMRSEPYCMAVVGSPSRLRELIELDAVDLAPLRFFGIHHTSEFATEATTPDLAAIASSLPPNVQMLAMLDKPLPVSGFDASILGDSPLTFEQEPSEKPRFVMQYHVSVKEKGRFEAVGQICESNPGEKIILICESKRTCENLARSMQLTRFGRGRTVYIHGGFTNAVKEEAAELFCNGVYPLLVTTDAILEVMPFQTVRLVVGYDAPPSSIAHVNRTTLLSPLVEGSSLITLYTPSDRRSGGLSRAGTPARLDTIPNLLTKTRTPLATTTNTTQDRPKWKRITERERPVRKVVQKQPLRAPPTPPLKKWAPSTKWGTRDPGPSPKKPSQTPPTPSRKKWFPAGSWDLNNLRHMVQSPTQTQRKYSASSSYKEEPTPIPPPLPALAPPTPPTATYNPAARHLEFASSRKQPPPKPAALKLPDTATDTEDEVQGTEAGVDDSLEEATQPVEPRYMEEEQEQDEVLQEESSLEEPESIQAEHTRRWETEDQQFAQGEGSLSLAEEAQMSQSSSHASEAREQMSQSSSSHARVGREQMSQSSSSHAAEAHEQMSQSSSSHAREAREQVSQSSSSRTEARERVSQSSSSHARVGREQMSQSSSSHAEEAREQMSQSSSSHARVGREQMSQSSSSHAAEEAREQMSQSSSSHAEEAREQASQSSSSHTGEAREQISQSSSSHAEEARKQISQAFSSHAREQMSQSSSSHAEEAREQISRSSSHVSRESSHTTRQSSTLSQQVQREEALEGNASRSSSASQVTTRSKSSSVHKSSDSSFGREGLTLQMEVDSFLPEERMLSEMFMVADEDGNGLISFEELKTLLYETTGEELTRNQYGQLLDDDEVQPSGLVLFGFLKSCLDRTRGVQAVYSEWKKTMAEEEYYDSFQNMSFQRLETEGEDDIELNDEEAPSFRRLTSRKSSSMHSILKSIRSVNSEKSLTSM